MAKLVIGTSKSVVVPAVVKEVTPVEPYPLLSRVKDDSNNEIGTVSGYFTDANNQKYAVVCLDAQYRGGGVVYLSGQVEVTGLALLNKQTLWENTDTATWNCDKIMDFITNNPTYTSTAVSFCRNKSFIIGGVTYFGQLPNIVELIDVFRHRTSINNADPTATQYSSWIVPSNNPTLSSSQAKAKYCWSVSDEGGVSQYNKDLYRFAIPVLEIPIN